MAHIHDPYIIGDFGELHSMLLEEKGPVKAAIWFWMQVLRFIPRLIVHFMYWRLVMFKSVFKLTIRNLKRHSMYAFINIAGLAVGMAASILIALFVLDELSFDRHHENAHRIYRVGTVRGIEKVRNAYTAPPTAQALKQDFPEIEAVARLCLWPMNRILKYRHSQFRERRIVGADSTIFQIFTIPFIAGDPGQALRMPGTAVITESTADKYFGDEDPLGKMLLIDGGGFLRVTGVVEDMPRTSHFHFDLMFSLNSMGTGSSQNWMNHTFSTYVLLREGADPVALEAKFSDFVRRHHEAAHQESSTGESYEAYASDPENYYGFWLEPLLNIHLNPDTNASFGVYTKGDIFYMRIFSLIAVFIVLIACINFMNLSTARFSNRFLDVGIRKVLGSGRPQLIRQFLFESVFMSFIALCVAFLLVSVSLPWFSDLTGRSFDNFIFRDVRVVLGLILFMFFIGLIAGSYPAFFLSSVQPNRALQGGFSTHSKGLSSLRRVLVIFQFLISVVIFFGSSVVYRQLAFIKHIDLGFEKEGILVIHGAHGLAGKHEAFKNELLNHANISVVSSTTSLPGRHFNGWGHRLLDSEEERSQVLAQMASDAAFARLLDLDVVRGRYFSEDMGSETGHIVVNEAAVTALGLDDPVGRRLNYANQEVRIIGVVRNIHFESLHQQIRPMVIYPIPGSLSHYLNVRIKGINLPATLQFVESKWKEMTNGKPLETSFLDEDLNMLYQNDRRIGRLLTAFSILAIFIACLGLFGLMSYSAERRTKEIGIRKMIGAQRGQIMILMCKEILFLILTASIVGAPIALYSMNRWLRNFAYRIDLTIWNFVFITLFMTMLAFITVAYRAIRSANTAPVEALRYE